MAYSTDTTGNAATADKLKTARTINGVSFDGSSDITVFTGGSVGTGYVSGNYYFCNTYGGPGTSASHGNGTLRLSPFVVTQTVTITRLFAAFTAAGEANSVLRLGIYNHDATTQAPTTVALDAGTISTGTGNAGTVATGGVTGTYELTVNKQLTPGLYWVGGVIQGASTTQPTVNTTRVDSVPFQAPLGTSLPGAGGFYFSWVQTGVTGALATLTSATPSGSVAPVRVGFKVA